MRQDISSLVETASSNRYSWTGARVAETLARLNAQISGATVDWEENDEDWGRILSKDGNVGAYICIRLPLVILDDNAVRCGIATPPDVVRLEVPSMAAPILRADKHRLEVAFGRVLSPNVDYDAFSADDLWWATV
jgi:hypothetical protein